MTGWRLWTVRASHAGAVSVLSWRWAATGDGTFGVAAGCLAVALAVTFLPNQRKRRTG
jgi:hypothetical protein